MVSSSYIVIGIRHVSKLMSTAEIILNMKLEILE